MTTISCVDTYNHVIDTPHCGFCQATLSSVQLLEMHPAVSCHRTFVPVSSAWSVLLPPQLLLHRAECIFTVHSSKSQLEYHHQLTLNGY